MVIHKKAHQHLYFILQSPLAASQHGYFSWIWRQRMVTEDEVMNECGLDALCFLRILKCGFRISLLGMCNAIWLMPLYDGAGTSEETEYISDSIIEVTIAHVPVSLTGSIPEPTA